MSKHLLTTAAFLAAFTVSPATPVQSQVNGGDVDNSQFEMPYHAFGGIALKGSTVTDIQTGKKVGETSYIYDSEGYKICEYSHSEYVDSETGLSMKADEESSDMKRMSTVYYFDEKSSKWELYSSEEWEKNVFDITITNISKHRNEKGELVTEVLCETEVDSEGRLVKTTSYTSSGFAQRVTDYEYTEDGLLVATSYYANNIIGDPVPLDKFAVKIDSNTGEVTRISYSLLGTKFVPDQKTVVTDDVRHGRYFYDIYSWEENNSDWVLISKDEKIEDENGGYRTYMLYYRDGSINYGTKEEWGTDAANGSEFLASYEYNDGIWVGKTKTETTMSDSDKASEKTVITFKWSNSDWVNDKKTYSYKSTDNMETNETDYRWNKESAAWTVRTSSVEKYILVNDQKKIETRDRISTGSAERQVYTYDSNGNTTSKTVFIQNDDKEWVPSEKETTEYDANGKKTLYREFTCDGAEGDTTWVSVKEEEFQYDADGNEIYYSYLSDWDQYSSQWYSGERNRTVSEKEGTVVNQYYEIWDSYNGCWKGDSRIETVHNDQEHTVCHYYYTDGQWGIYSMTEYQYDNGKPLGWKEYGYFYTPDYEYDFDVVKRCEISWSGDTSSTVVRSYSSGDGEWHYESKEVSYTTADNWNVSSEFNWRDEEWNLKSTVRKQVVVDGIYTSTTTENYNSNNELTRTQTVVVDNNGTEVENKYLMLSPYYTTGSWSQTYFAENGKIAMEARYTWNSSMNAFVGSSRTDYEYDEKGRVIRTATYRYDTGKGAWIGSGKYGVSYDDDDNQIGTESYQWDSANNKWRGTFKVESYQVNEGNVQIFVNTRWDWDETADDWIPVARYTDTSTYNSDGNVEYSVVLDEFWDNDKSSWYVGLNYRTDYIYGTIAGVEPVTYAVASIKSVDGILMVDASAGSMITVRTVSGVTVATARGSLEIDLPAAIYLVTVDSVTTKIVVR